MSKNHYSLILTNCNIKDENVINVYPFGSKVYKTDNYKSDYDYILVSNKDFNKEDRRKFSNINVNIYSENYFLEQLKRHRMSTLECFFLPKDLLLKETKQYNNFKINSVALQKYALEKSNEDWTRALKLSIIKEESLFVKAIFHSLRTLDFAKQIIESGQIINYQSCNDYWEDLLACKERSYLWDPYVIQYYTDEYYKLITEVSK